MRLLLAVVLPLMPFGACEMEPSSLPVIRSEVIGVYLATYEAGLTESIILRDDSSYTYYFLGHDSSEYIIEDRWDFEPGGGFLRFSPVVFLKGYQAPYLLDGLCFCDDCPPQFVHRDSTHYTYGISVFKSDRSPLRLVRCPNQGQFYEAVKLNDSLLSTN